MLSAVAARKARLAQSQTQNTTPAVSAPSSSASPPPSEAKKKAASSSSSQKPPSSKRKSSTSVGGNVPKKKRSEQRRPPEQPARYFAQAAVDAFKTQEDVIVVDESDAESSASSHSSRIAEDVAVPPAPGRPKRAWSPSAPLPDSSDEDNEEGGEPIVLDFPLSAPLQQVLVQPPSSLSSFDPVLNQNVFHLAPGECLLGDTAHKSTILLLGSGETVALLGTYTITVLRGTVSVAGVQLTAGPTSHPVYASRSSPIPIIQCRLSRSTTAPTPLLPALPERIADASPNFDATILLQELHTGIEGLGRICRTFDGCFAPARWHRSQARFDMGLDTVYFLERQTPDVSPLVVLPSWDAAIGSAVPPPSVDENELVGRAATYLVKGPKNAGKSTFARLLLNRLLSRFKRVAYLECDLGQSEFTPGGMVSLNVVEQPLFGPPFTHPSTPHASHYIGATSPKNSPSHYLDSIQALMQLYHADLQNAALDEDDTSNASDGRISSIIPLVINTMGWTKGLGADLGRKVEEIIEPAHIFSFAPPTLEDDWHAASAGPSYSHQGPVPNGATTIHTVESAPPSSLSSHYTAADQRNISMLSYFHAVFPDDPPSSPHTSPIAVSWTTSLPLCAQPPYQVDCATAFDKLVLTGAGMEDVVPSEVHRALNCALVALVRCEPGTIDSDMSIDAGAGTDGSVFSLSMLPYDQGAPAPSPYTSRCLGLALVRGVSLSGPAPAQIQLLTPVPVRLLGEARVLVMGEMQLPVWGMLDFRTLDDGGDVAGVEKGRVPYLRWGKGEGAGGERRRVRRNLMRREQM
ncbi:hypothetical protein L226DRAFT_473738 [Lentinus tigrinus ALCF2SS1-7]|uniref:Polynucleotide 5'-hydroxyl-kinase GRC3 n=1 Tax=Lentinus tigrinus ALCF2SS1-6 TaxID=1328759 RepID=A0A5C2RMK1_9APHY|nr:hypothetical protein L227DRAFT_514135 [Lentinus tigrinus ALCF2SS1-6]RPD68265.1 hypothetical protein L226DRAFT_473738 [Lentinus tigrinus ALCF2SS1-7]